MNIYYIYMYLREDGTPYYVGKGKNRRAYEKHDFVPVPMNKDRILFIEENLNEHTAYERERQYITQLGRVINSTGILLNRSPGRSGGSTRYKAPVISKPKPPTNTKIDIAYRELSCIGQPNTVNEINDALNKLLNLYKSIYNLNDAKNVRYKIDQAVFDLTKKLHSLVNVQPKRKTIPKYKKR